MRKIVVVFLVISSLYGCVGKTGIVRDDLFPSNDYSQSMQKKVLFESEGMGLFVGRPSGLASGAWSVSVDLKGIQEKAAGKVIEYLCSNVSPSPDHALKVLSSITDFKYYWKSSLSGTTPVISFKMNIRALDNDNTINTIEVKELPGDRFNSTWSEFFRYLAFGTLGEVASGNPAASRGSQAVTDIALLASYKIYHDEFPKILER